MALKRLLRLASAFLLAMLCLASFAMAQTETGTISGLVMDPTGTTVPGAEVELRSVERGTADKATTNSAGIYVFASVHPGQYQLTVRKAGFKQVDLLGMIVNVQDHIEQNIRLQIGSVAESVTVKAEASLLNTTDGSIGTVIDRQFVENLPLNGRTFQRLIALTPGVIQSKATANDLGQFSVNGQRADANYFSVDGVSANVFIVGTSGLGSSGAGALPSLTADGGTNSLVSVDALEELRVQTSSNAPEFGRQPGGQVQIVTRSGTNAFHGSLFEYFRNDVLDANDWFGDRAGLRKPALRQNDFGGVFGGPIIKNRTFFFASFEGLRIRLPQTKVTLVPSSAARLMPSPVQPFLNGYPVSNGGPAGSNLEIYNAAYSDPSTFNGGSIRIDQFFNDKLKLFGRYNIAPSERSTRSIPVSVLTFSSFETHTLTIGLTWLVKQNMSNEFRFNWSRNKGFMTNSLDTIGGATLPPNSVLFPTGSISDSAIGFSLQDGAGQLSAGLFGRNVQRQINFVDTLSVTQGTHQLKFGMDYRYLSPEFGGQNSSQIAIFPDVATALTGVAPFVVVGASDPITIAFHNLSLFAQDTWKVGPRLTLTYGLRWELNPPPHGKDGKELITARGIDNPATLALAPPGTPLYQTSYHNFAPRAGIAYLLSDKKGWTTVLRAGFGFYYDLGSGESATASGTFPYSRFKLLFGVPYPLSAANAAPLPFNPNPPTVSFVLAFDPNLSLPVTYQWNLAIQQSLGSDQAVTIAYVGAAGRDLLRQQLLVAPNPQFTDISITNNSSTSDYESLQLQYSRHLSRRLQALAAYTWSHSIDTFSNNSFDTGGGARGASDFDVRHSFNTALTYDLPNPKAGAIGNVILRDWSTDAILVARSATPVDLIGGFTLVGPVNELQRPDLIAGQPLYVSTPGAPGGRVFNRMAFGIPAPGRQGTFGRNVLRGFNSWQLDFAVHRQFSFNDRANLQFRAEFFNILNHPNFGDPTPFTGTFLFSPLFGQSTQTLGQSLGLGGQGLNPLFQIGGPRSIQFALKLTF